MNSLGSVVNRDSNSIFSLNYRDKKDNKAISLEIGEIISATITEKNKEKTTLKTKDNFEFTVDSKSLSGELGDLVQFEVVKNSKNNLTLKQIGADSQKEAFQLNKKTEIKSTHDFFKQSNLIKDEDKCKSEEDEEKLKELKAINLIKQKLFYGGNNISKNLVSELIGNGLSIEKISFNILTSAMKELKSHNIKPTDEEISKAIEEYFADKNKKDVDIEIVKTFAKKGLPINEKNINSIQQALDKFEDIKNIDNNTLVSVLKSGKDITIDNLYFSKYSLKEAFAPNRLSSEDEDSLIPEIEKVFEREGISNNKTNINIAKFFVENQIPVNKENIDKVLFLKNLSKYINTKEVLEKGTELIKSGKSAGEINIMSPTENRSNDTDKLNENYKDIIKALPSISHNKIGFLVRNNMPVTIFNLRNVLSDNENTIYNQDLTDVHADSVVTAKRHLAEIQLKLNIEAAQRLSGKGINIDTMPLKEALEQLKQLEKESYSSNLKIMGADATDSNIQTMSNLYDVMGRLNPLTNNVFSSIINKEARFSIKGIHEQVMKARAVEGYEAFATIADPKYGDSFSKVRSQIEPFLQNIGIEPTPENIKATAILSKNKIDVNEETVNQVKLIHEKINYVVNKLHPNIAASIIKDGLNPLDMHIDEIISFIDKFENEYGEDLGNKIASFILEMDDNKTLSKDERNSIIAIYRTLNSIQKDGGVALGVTLKQGQSLTLGSMFEASKYYQKAKKTDALYDVNIDNNFGGLSSMVTPESNIRSTLQAIASTSSNEEFTQDEAENEREYIELLNSSNMSPTKENLQTIQNLINTQNKLNSNNLTDLSYRNIIFKNFSEKASPNILNKIISEYPEYMNIPVENFMENINEIASNQEISDKKLDNLLQQLQNVFNIQAKAINMLESNNITTNLANLNAISSLLKDEFYIGNEIDNLRNENNIDLSDVVLDKDLTQLEEGKTPNDILNSVSEKIDELKEEETSSELLRQFDLIQNAIKVQSSISNIGQRSEIKLPVQLHNKIAGLNMYVLNNNYLNENENSILMTLNTSELGNVKVYINMQGDDVSLRINSNLDNALEFMESEYNKLVSFVQDAGFNVTNIKFGEEGFI